jgi:hypothetical protein
MKAEDAENNVNKRNYWDCAYNDLTSTSFFGRSTWFEQHGKGTSKETPKDIVDKICKFFEPRK